MKRLLFAALLFTTTVTAADDDGTYRSYSCADWKNGEKYISIVVGEQPAEGSRYRRAVVVIDGASFTGVAYQDGLEYRVAFDTSKFAIFISKSGQAEFYKQKVGDKTRMSYVSDIFCERTK